MTSEREIERYLVKRVKEAGGKAYKFVSPGTIGVPDRIVVLPNSFLAFVEVKAPGKKPRPEQLVQLNRLKKLHQIVRVVDSKEEVDKLITLFELTQMFIEDKDEIQATRLSKILH